MFKELNFPKINHKDKVLALMDDPSTNDNPCYREQDGPVGALQLLSFWDPIHWLI
jgi:hypothetical protein